MRLIDAERIVYSWIIDKDGEEHDGITLQSIIDKMPTVDAERHGRWIEKDDECECPFCGATWNYMDNCTETFNYCPFCGAKMDAPTQKSVGNALEALEPYRDEEGHWAIDSNPYRAFEQFAKECDIVEVVRCKDCKWWKTNYMWNGNEHKVCVIEPYEPVRNEDDYCSRGERKEDGNT